MMNLITTSLRKITKIFEGLVSGRSETAPPASAPDLTLVPAPTAPTLAEWLQAVDVAYGEAIRESWRRFKGANNAWIEQYVNEQLTKQDFPTTRSGLK